jgi:hypothetical protein
MLSERVDLIFTTNLFMQATKVRKLLSVAPPWNKSSKEIWFPGSYSLPGLEKLTTSVEEKYCTETTLAPQY